MQKKNIEVLFVNNLNVVNKDTFVDKKETITKIGFNGSKDRRAYCVMRFNAVLSTLYSLRIYLSP